MATFDGSSSLDMASDDFREHECGPCALGGKHREAKHYCIDCPDYLCDDCQDYHCNLAVTRNHTIVSSSRIPATARGTPSLGITCDCNKGQPIAFYCNDHQDIICSACKTFNHHKCKTSSIQEKCSGYKLSRLNSVLTEIKSLKVKYERLKQESSGSKREVNTLKEACKKEINGFRKELNRIFDDLESNMLTELDKWEQDKDRLVDQDVSTITTAMNVLQVDCKRLEDAKRDGKKETMFIADVQVSKALKTYKRKLVDLEKEIEKPRLAFERNELLADLAAGIKALGTLKTQHNGHKLSLKQPGESVSTSLTKMLADRKIKSNKEVNVRTNKDKTEPWITGCTVMPNGHVVLCDRGNKQIKLLDNSWTIAGQLALPDPWDVSVIDSNNVILSTLNMMQLQKVQLFPKMKAGSTIQLDKQCWGVAVSGQEIYTTCHDDPGRGEVRVLDMQGNIKRRLGINPDAIHLFNRSYYITVSASGEKIFISDIDACTITCMTTTGRVSYTCKDYYMRYPTGLICDSGDNVLVCCEGPNYVYTISPDGNKYRILLTSKDGLSGPYSIAYKESEDTLIVGCQCSNKLLLFKLA